MVMLAVAVSLRDHYFSYFRLKLKVFHRLVFRGFSTDSPLGGDSGIVSRHAGSMETQSSPPPLKTRLSPKALGRFGETLATAVLAGSGLRLIEKNWRASAGKTGVSGEIDLVMRDQDVTVFVEVKTRWSGSPAEALELVTPLKLERIKKLGLAWLAEHEWGEHRIDALGITCSPKVSYQWVRGLA